MKNKKKRVHLTNEELALGSWLYVILHIANDENFDTIYECKRNYLQTHNIYDWKNMCLYCNKYFHYACVSCPLKDAEKKEGMKFDDIDWCGCDSFTWYDNVIHPNCYSQKKRIGYALKICEIFAKELKRKRTWWYGLLHEKEN